VTSPGPVTSPAAAELERLGGAYFTLVHTLDPFTATQPGVLEQLVTRWADYEPGRLRS